PAPVNLRREMRGMHAAPGSRYALCSMEHPPRDRLGLSRSSGIWLAILYIFLWASAFVPSKILAIEAQPLWMLVIRFLAAGLVLYTLGFAMRRPLPTAAKGWL